MKRGVCATALLLAFVAPIARADDDAPPRRDVHHGRADGDFGVVVGAGPVIAPRGARGAVDLRLRYVDTLGLFFGYEDSLGGSTDPKRLFGGGLELRPLYLLRTKRGLGETGLARFDLLVDSIGLELGTYVGQERGSQLATKPGLQVGLGIELPVLASATGVWVGVHGGMRWNDGALAGEPVRGPADRSGYLALTVSWHQIFGRGK